MCIIPGWLDLTRVLPPVVAWGAVTLAILLNHAVIAGVTGPILLGILYPIVKRRGLYWRDRHGSDQNRNVA